jgi:predicted nucleic acid-binding protein
MTYLLDVNGLLALGFQNHEFHRRVALWVRTEQPAHLATCSITELGFVRVLAQTPGYDLTIGQACTLLLRLKESVSPQFTFINDSHDVSHLPSWVKTPRQIADGHLAQLAKANGAILATLDRKIPGAFLIPEL